MSWRLFHFSDRSWLIPAFSILAFPLLILRSAPSPVAKKPSVEVVFCIDTTGSMAGLIEGAKQKIWSMCNQILGGRPMPNLKVGLIAYRDKGDDYVSRVYNLREDFDEVYSDLQTFSANGGGDTPEHVNKALDDAINKIKWSEDRATLKIIFLVGDAAAHMDYDDDVKYPINCARATDRGILINTLQCGNDPECAKHWKDISERAGGAYATLPQGGGVRPVSTPFDKRMAAINTELTRGIIIFGEAEKREADKKKVQAILGLSPEVAADRVGYLAKEGRMAVPYDLVEAVKSGMLRLESLRETDFPSEMQKMTIKGRQDHLETTTSPT
ncbi:MAG: vWA domain-containing protein, partial [Gemmataceae bacterium]